MSAQFSEFNTVEQMTVAALQPHGWQYVPGKDLPRKPEDVILWTHLRDALVRLNPEIAAKPDRADEVLYKLRAIIVGVGQDGLIRSNELFFEYLTGEKSFPFGPNGDYVTVRLIDFDAPTDPTRNQFVVSNQVTFRASGASTDVRFDVVLYVNGLPLVVGEAKTPTRPAVTWVDGASDLHHYQNTAREFFVPNVLLFATEGKEFRYGSVFLPLDNWAPWRDADNVELPGLEGVRRALDGLLNLATLLDVLSNFTLFSTNKQGKKIKVVCRYQQFHGANQIVERVVAGRLKKGLIWHFQGSGKSYLMVFAARKLRATKALNAPTVFVVVDRVDLDTQISGTFNAADVPNTVPIASTADLERAITADTRKILITTIFKFGELPPTCQNARDNIIVLVDEAHRTQEGDMGRKMRTALPKAFFFGLTGTPINKTDKNTFFTFGADEDPGGYMNRYTLQDAIRDGATLPLHFDPRLVELRIDKAALDEAFKQLTGSLTEVDQNELGKRAAKLGVLLKAPQRVAAVCADIAKHFREHIEPNGFKGQVVTFDREACDLYKKELDKHLPPEASAVVITVTGDEPEYAGYDRDADEERKLLDRFRDPADPLKLLIVTAKLLTGFDAPVLQAMYLDKPIREHNLLQAVCRVNRPFKNKKHGVIADYLGVFDDVAAALAFDEKSVQAAVGALKKLRDLVPGQVAKCVAFFPNVDRSISGYEGLIAAQQCLPDNEKRDAFAKAFSELHQMWEALHPDACLTPFRADYEWLADVYESVKPPSGHGKLLWHALGAKTLELIKDHVHVSGIRDLESVVLDPDMIEGLDAAKDPRKLKKLEIQIVARLRRHEGNPLFVALGDRLEKLRERHEQGLIDSLAFLKELLQIARETLEAEKAADPKDEQDRAKAALTELFKEVKHENTPVIVEKLVDEIDSIVRLVRFAGWQTTVRGEREVQKALRASLMKYKLQRDQDLFDRAYGYIKQYY
jgi:type I restriction enzyme R subunit